MRVMLSYRAAGAMLFFWSGVFNVVLESVRTCAMHDSVVPMHAMAITHQSAPTTHCRTRDGASASPEAGARESSTEHDCTDTPCTCQGDGCSTPAVGLPPAPPMPGVAEQCTRRSAELGKAFVQPARADLQLPPATAPPESLASRIA